MFLNSDWALQEYRSPMGVLCRNIGLWWVSCAGMSVFDGCPVQEYRSPMGVLCRNVGLWWVSCAEMSVSDVCPVQECRSPMCVLCRNIGLWWMSNGSPIRLISIWWVNGQGCRSSMCLRSYKHIDVGLRCVSNQHDGSTNVYVGLRSSCMSISFGFPI